MSVWKERRSNGGSAMAQHLTFAERKVLYRLKKEGYSKAEIARVLERHRSTIGRELARNTGGRGYRPRQAQRLADQRRRACRRRCRLDDPELRDFVQERLERLWSPDQIACRTRRDFPRQPRRWLSRQTIYDWILRRAPAWRALLRRGGRSPESRGKLKECVSIHGRPHVINRRRRYGDWEGDTIVGRNRRGGLLTLVERKSGYARIARLDDLTSATTLRAGTRCLKDLPASLRRSITFDNGKEFAEHRRLAARLDLDVYFAQPYRSWQRGTNENTNGLLRQFFPKRTDFRSINPRDIARVEQLLNERPRRRLGYRTPAEVLAHKLCCV
jgi:transposase, IS30 family